MEKKRYRNGLILMVGGIFLWIMGLTGCASHDSATLSHPSCKVALGDNYHRLTDFEIVRLLDEALLEECNECLYNCWIPLMKKALQEGRDLPRKHLLQAVKVFNQKQHDKFFHLAAYSYFDNLVRSRETYREIDRKFLRAYCTTLVNHSRTRDDRQLVKAMELCRRLDQELYRKIFQ
ncbi:MAG: hypothetical protein JXR89_04615 [Deltaproteobacteria bacterium]|nr:hypothetical protein [Deltaproteobacteria bacterium]